MNNFKLKHEHINPNGETETSCEVNFSYDDLTSVVASIECFLKACGWSFEELEIVHRETD